jgi:hypothetical protein
MRSCGITGSAERRGAQRTPRAGAAHVRRWPRVAGRDRQVMVVRPRTGDSRRSLQRSGHRCRHEDDAWLRPGFQDEGRVHTIDLRQRPPQPRSRAAGAADRPPVPAVDLTWRLRRLLLDFGRNIVGRLKLRARGSGRDGITARHPGSLRTASCAYGRCVRLWRPTTSSRAAATTPSNQP